MKYDFTTIMDRHGRDAVAIDGLGLIPGMTPDAPKPGFDAIPLWIADMNFPTAPSIIQALRERVEHPAFGYFLPTPAYYEAIANWQKSRHGVDGLTQAQVGYENGVIGGLISALRVFCCQGDKVLLHAPTYTGFTWALEANGFRIVHSPLIRDADGVWRMDYEDMEKKLRENRIHAAVVCSPFNPCGRVWTREELERMMALYKKYDVMVVSDEIWSDLVLAGHQHIPTQTVSEDAKQRTVALYAPSKTFNLAGLIGSYHIVYNERIRDQLDKQESLSRYNEMNVLSMHALIGAYSPTGAEWVDELLQVLTENTTYAWDFVRRNLPGVSAFKPEGTYMLYLDCTEWCKAHGKTITDVVKAGYDVGLAWQDGRQYGSPCHIRLNLALPLSRVQEAMRRMQQYVFLP